MKALQQALESLLKRHNHERQKPMKNRNANQIEWKRSKLKWCEAGNQLLSPSLVRCHVAKYSYTVVVKLLTHEALNYDINVRS